MVAAAPWFFCFCLVAGTVYGQDFDIPEDQIPTDKYGKKMVRFQAPKLTEEESHSTRMPSNLKCDGCLAVTFKIHEKLQLLHSRFSTKRAPEAELLDALEDSCQAKNYESVGVKEIKGQTRLTGPGLYGEKTPGLMQGGGRWPTRLKDMCSEFMGELDQEDIYNAHLSAGGLEGLRQLMCHGKGTLGSCVGTRSKDEL